MTYEDELPEDITDEEYALWFERSTVDGVRVGPSIEFVHSLIAAQHAAVADRDPLVVGGASSAADESQPRGG